MSSVHDVDEVQDLSCNLVDGADLLSYWNARYFEGITPPLMLRTPAAVRACLQHQPEAIASLPSSKVDDSLRVLLELRD